MNPEKSMNTDYKVELEHPDYLSFYSQMNNSRVEGNTDISYFYYKVLPAGSIFNNIHGRTAINKQSNINLFLNIVLNKENERIKHNRFNFEEYFAKNINDKLKDNNYSYFPCSIKKSFKITNNNQKSQEPLFVNYNTSGGFDYLQLTNRYYYYDNNDIQQEFYLSKNNYNLNNFKDFKNYMDFFLNTGKLATQSLLEKYWSNETINIKVFDFNLSPDKVSQNLTNANA
jgi:hypothetical protein